MGTKRVRDRRIVVNYKGEFTQTQLRMNIMKHFIEEQVRRQEMGQERGNGLNAGYGGKLYWRICEDQQGRQR